MMRCSWGILLFAFFAGCGSGLPRTVPVNGRVLFDGGPPPAVGSIYFTVPGDAGGSMRPATGDFDAAGNFRATTFKPGDGLLPGKFKLRLECYQTPPNMEGKPVQSYLPSWYENAEQNGLELTVDTTARGYELTITVDTKTPENGKLEATKK